MNRATRSRLFDMVTVELLAHKYLYYIKSTPIISDAQYDRLEKLWEGEGCRLGLNMADYSPWVDFPQDHWLVEVAIRASEDVGLLSYEKCLALLKPPSILE